MLHLPRLSKTLLRSARVVKLRSWALSVVHVLFIPHISLHYPALLRSEHVVSELLCLMASAFWPYLAAFRAEHDACERELLDIFLAGMHLAQ